MPRKKVVEEASPTKQPPCDDVTQYCGFCCKMDTKDNLLTCDECGNSGHPSCMSMPAALEARIRAAGTWSCIECKKCVQCTKGGDEDKMLFCDACDHGTHMYCLDPPLTRAPKGDWNCPDCVGGDQSSVASSTKATPKTKKRKSSMDALLEEADNETLVIATSDTPSERKKSKTPVPASPSPAPSSPPRKRDKPDTKSKDSSKHDGKKQGKKKDKGKKASGEEIEVDDEDQALFDRAREVAHQSLADGGGVGQPRVVQIGAYEADAWYSAPYPEEYARLNRLYLCEFCLRYVKSQQMLTRHQEKCDCPGHPPGTEIYRSGRLQIWEVDGKKAKIYCQNLCLLAKLFLDHKTLYYDVEPFLFYVLTEYDEYGSHIMGYFSKEKGSILNYNVSCILTMPYAMRKGYGKFLIDFSYLLTRKEKKTGTPEKPLSKLGKLSYTAYWRDAIFKFLHENKDKELDIASISSGTGMDGFDVMEVLKAHNMLKLYKGQPAIVKDVDAIAAHVEKLKEKTILVLDEEKLKWTPFSTRMGW